jgi:hypothetical protein
MDGSLESDETSQVVECVCVWGVGLTTCSKSTPEVHQAFANVLWQKAWLFVLFVLFACLLRQLPPQGKQCCTKQQNMTEQLTKPAHFAQQRLERRFCHIANCHTVCEEEQCGG